MDVEAKLAALSPDWSRLLLFVFYQQNGTVLFSVRLLLACFQQQQCGTAVPRTFARHGTEHFSWAHTHRYAGTRDIGHTVL